MTKKNNTSEDNNFLKETEDIIKQFPSLIFQVPGTLPGWETLRNISEAYREKNGGNVPPDEVRKQFAELIAVLEKGRTQSKKGVKYIPKTFIVTDNYLIEQFESGYIQWDRKTDTYEIIQEYHTGEFIPNPDYRPPRKGETSDPETLEIVYVPLVNKTVETGQIVLPGEPIECNSLMDIVREIETIAKKYIYIAEEEKLTFNLHLRLAVVSWFLSVFADRRIQEKVGGLLSIVGTSGGGKKRWLTVLRQVLYRPVYILNTDKIPSIFRLLEPWETASLLIDEADQRDTGSDSEWTQFLNARYDGVPISRYNTQNQDNDIFQSFGMTAIALRRMPTDEGITSRMVQLNATPAAIAVPEIVGTDIYEAFDEIRRKLFYLHLKWYRKLVFVGSSGLPVERSWRVKETLTLIRMMAQIDPAIEDDIDQISIAQTEREILAMSQTWDGVIINELFALICNDRIEPDVHNRKLYFSGTYEKNGPEGPNVLTYAITTMQLAKSLATTTSAINRSLRPFKISTDRFRLGGKNPTKGIITFDKIRDTDRLFYRYIPGYKGELLKYGVTLGLVSVPDVPFVSADRVSVSKKEDHDHDSDIHVAGTLGTWGTLPSEQKDSQSQPDTVNSDVQSDYSANTDPGITVSEAEAFLEELKALGYFLDRGIGASNDSKTFKIGVIKPLDKVKREALPGVMAQHGFAPYNSGAFGVLFFTKPLRRDP